MADFKKLRVWEKAHALMLANSGFELEYHLIAARDIGAISEGDSEIVICQVIEVRKMLYGLLRKLGHPPMPRPPEHFHDQQR